MFFEFNRKKFCNLYFEKICALWKKLRQGLLAAKAVRTRLRG